MLACTSEHQKHTGKTGKTQMWPTCMSNVDFHNISMMSKADIHSIGIMSNMDINKCG